MQMSFLETVSDSLCRNDLVMQTDCCSSCPGGLSQTILEVKINGFKMVVTLALSNPAKIRPYSRKKTEI